MARDGQFDDKVSRWMEETAPARLPERVLEATFERTRRRRQHVGWRAALGRFDMHRFIPALGSAVVVVVVAALALDYVVNQPGFGGPPRPAAFTTAGHLAEARSNHAAILLDDSRVLVIGGGTVEPGGAVDSLEAWDASSGAFSSAGRMTRSRSHHTATLLPDGLVLIVGGNDGKGAVHETAELWDPQTGRSSEVGRLAEARAEHTATLLPDGRVLVVGGRGGFNLGTGEAPVARTAEVWDPGTRSFAPAGVLATARRGHTATLLDQGRVLIVGGSNEWNSLLNGPQAIDPSLTAELWDPVPGSFGELLSAQNPFGPFGHSATRLEDGRVLIVGSHRAQIFDPERGFLPGPPIFAHDGHTATLLDGGTVLLIGGGSGEATAYLWDPTGTGVMTQAGRLEHGRAWHSATLLPDGSVLVAGGWDYLGTLGPNDPGGYLDLASAELWRPAE